MTEFKRIADETGGWDDYDWSKPSLAVVAMGECGGFVLWTVGAHVAFDIKETGLGGNAEDLGIEPDDEGIFIWEGKTKSSRDYEGEYDSWLDGEFREPTEAEWASIRRGECPWNPDERIRPEALARIKAAATEPT